MSHNPKYLGYLYTSQTLSVYVSFNLNRNVDIRGCLSLLCPCDLICKFHRYYLTLSNLSALLSDNCLIHSAFELPFLYTFGFIINMGLLMVGMCFNHCKSSVNLTPVQTAFQYKVKRLSASCHKHTLLSRSSVCFI